jgi:hypothetical protein
MTHYRMYHITMFLGRSRPEETKLVLITQEICNKLNVTTTPAGCLRCSPTSTQISDALSLPHSIANMLV